jgi:hypothetical protein
VKAGKTIKEDVPPGDLYTYPQFTRGTVFFRNGKSSSAPLNYNQFLDEMQFITSKGDTLTLIDEKNIAFININSDTFFYDEGYLKLAGSAPSVKLGTKDLLKVIYKKKLGAYGMTSATESIASYKTFDDERKLYELTVMEDIVLAPKRLYYIANNHNHFLLASKKSLMKLFPKLETALVDYLRENEVDFENQEDLKKLMQFIARQ